MRELTSLHRVPWQYIKGAVISHSYHKRGINLTEEEIEYTIAEINSALKVFFSDFEPSMIYIEKR